MKINVEKYRSIADGRQITDRQVMERTGLSERTFNWIMENKFIELDTLEHIADVIGCSVQDIAVFDNGELAENVIEWVKDLKTATVTLTQRRYITKIKQYAAKRPEECKILAENADGSICARIPVSWVKISPPKNYTEEQKKEMQKRFNLGKRIL